MDAELLLEQNFYGTATVGERGQVVIPADARKRLSFHPGDKVLVIGHPAGSGLLLCKIESIRDILSGFLEELKRIEATVTETQDGNAVEH